MKIKKTELKLELIEDSLKRSGVFFRRRGGLMKKACELSKLCGVEVGVVFTDLKGHVHSFKTHEKIHLDASRLLENNPMKKRKKKSFEYSESDYPFMKVSKMTREVKELCVNLENSPSDSNNQLLRKRSLNWLDKLNKQPDEGRSEPKKHLKIDQIQNQNEDKKIENFKEKTSNLSAFQNSGGEENPSEYKYDHFHSVNLKEMIIKLDKGTHRMAKKFQKQSPSTQFLKELKVFHQLSNEYANSKIDLNFEEFWFWRVIIASYFSEQDSLLIQSLRKIPLTQITELLRLWRLKSEKKAKNQRKFSEVRPEPSPAP